MKDNLVSFFGRVLVSIDNPVLGIDRCILANAVCFLSTVLSLDC